MAKVKKNSISLNIKIDEDISHKLEKQAAKEDRTKTAIVERALKDYFEKQNDKDNKNK